MGRRRVRGRVRAVGGRGYGDGQGFQVGVHACKPTCRVGERPTGLTVGFGLTVRVHDCHRDAGRERERDDYGEHDRDDVPAADAGTVRLVILVGMEVRERVLVLVRSGRGIGLILDVGGGPACLRRRFDDIVVFRLAPIQLQSRILVGADGIHPRGRRGVRGRFGIVRLILVRLVMPPRVILPVRLPLARIRLRLLLRSVTRGFGFGGLFGCRTADPEGIPIIRVVVPPAGMPIVRRVPGIVRDGGVNVSLGGRVRRWRVLVFRFVTRRPVPLSPVPQGIPVIIRHGLHGRILPPLRHGRGLRVGLSERIERHSPMLCADTRSSCSPPSS